MTNNRAPGMSWLMRQPSTYPNGYVVTAPNDEIRISYFENEKEGRTLFMSRDDARLLAKRINQCLDATVKS